MKVSILSLNLLLYAAAIGAQETEFSIVNNSSRSSHELETQIKSQMLAIEAFAGAQSKVQVLARDCRYNESDGGHFFGKINLCADSHPSVFAHEFGHHICHQIFSEIPEVAKAQAETKIYHHKFQELKKNSDSISEHISQLGKSCAADSSAKAGLRELILEHQQIAIKSISPPPGIDFLERLEPYVELCADVVAVLSSKNPRFVSEAYDESSEMAKFRDFSLSHSIASVEKLTSPHMILAPVRSILWKKWIKNSKTNSEKEKVFRSFKRSIHDEILRFIENSSSSTTRKMNESFLDKIN